MSSLKNVILLVFAISSAILFSCNSETILPIEDGQISFIWEDSTYIIDSPLVRRETDIHHGGPDVSVITISGRINSREEFTIWVRNYHDEPIDCILETDYYTAPEKNEDSCIFFEDRDYCNGASISVSENSGGNLTITKSTGEGKITIEKCEGKLVSGKIKNKGGLESGIFQNLVIE